MRRTTGAWMGSGRHVCEVVSLPKVQGSEGKGSPKSHTSRGDVEVWSSCEREMARKATQVGGMSRSGRVASVGEPEEQHKLGGCRGLVELRAWGVVGRAERARPRNGGGKRVKGQVLTPKQRKQRFPSDVGARFIAPEAGFAGNVEGCVRVKGQVLTPSPSRRRMRKGQGSSPDPSSLLGCARGTEGARVGPRARAVPARRGRRREKSFAPGARDQGRRPRPEEPGRRRRSRDGCAPGGGRALPLWPTAYGLQPAAPFQATSRGRRLAC